MGNPLLAELKALKKSCDELLDYDRRMFKDNENLMGMAEKACYSTFYEITAEIIKRFEKLEEQEAADYENFLYGGKNNEI